MIKKIFVSLLFLGISTLGYGQSINMTPTNGNRGQSLPILISGQNTQFTSQGSGTALLYLVQGSMILGAPGNAFTNITVVNSNTMVANLSIPQNASLGVYDLYLNAGTSLIQSQAFTVNTPSNASLAMVPSGTKPGTTVTVTITVPGGSFKTMGQKVDQVWLNYGSQIVTGGNISVVNSTTITADFTFPTSGITYGLWDANVYTDDEMMFTSPGAFLVDPTFSIPELETIQFRMYPNPAHDFLMLEYNTPASAQLRVMNLAGKDVSNRISFLPQDDHNTKLDLSRIQDGVYMIQLVDGHTVLATRKFVKQ